MELLTTRGMLFWFTAVAGALPMLLALISALYYLWKQGNMRGRLGPNKDRKTREMRRLIEELKESADETAPYKRLLQNDMMSVQDYIKTRVDPTIVGYSSNAVASSIFYTCFTILQIIYAAMIPIVLLAGDKGNYEIFLGAVLGAMVLAVCTVNAMGRFKEKWVQYLGLRDRLFAERSLYMASGVYRKDLWRRRNGFDYNFVELCENIIALEYRNLSDKLDISDGLEAEPIDTVETAEAVSALSKITALLEDEPVAGY